MSTFQEMIQFFNNTHVRNAIHENVCVIFYGTDLIIYRTGANTTAVLITTAPCLNLNTQAPKLVRLKNKTAS